VSSCLAWGVFGLRLCDVLFSSPRDLALRGDCGACTNACVGLANTTELAGGRAIVKAPRT
jgi:hypothetical protein